MAGNTSSIMVQYQGVAGWYCIRGKLRGSAVTTRFAPTTTTILVFSAARASVAVTQCEFSLCGDKARARWTVR